MKQESLGIATDIDFILLKNHFLIKNNNFNMKPVCRYMYYVQSL